MKIAVSLLLLLLLLASSCKTGTSTLYSNSVIRDDSDISLVILTQGLDEPPRIKRGKVPAHPIGQGATSGSAVLEFTITEEGKTEDVIIIDKEGDGFAGNATYAVRYWRFHPAMKSGVPVECRVRYAVRLLGSRSNTNFKMD